MNVYDTANKLASELKNSPEYLTYKKLKEELNQNNDIKEKMLQFEKARYDAQLETLKGEEAQKEKMEEAQKIYAELIQNEFAMRYFDAELKFNVLLADVNKIIAESVQDVLI